MSELFEWTRGRRVLALTGAGCSTDSGIPDYRSPASLLRKRTPIKYLPFVRQPEVRQRYWARSTVGWPWFRDRAPNPTHHALSSLEARGLLTGVITQNVDRLHHKAGSQDVLELHGALADVVCLDCGARVSRDALQRRLLAMNPGLALDSPEYAPDGDAVLPESVHSRFRVPPCVVCDGVLKPDVVFFGENVARPIVARAWEMVDDADALLVLGSSLTVYSGFRFVKGAHERGMPIAIVNLGPTRADDLADLRLDHALEPALSTLTQRLF